jgi:hypothetical protein
MTAPELRQLRVVFDHAAEATRMLRTFAVYEGAKIVANGYIGITGTTVAWMARPNEWHQLPDRDVLAAMRGFFRVFPCEITVEEPEAEKGGAA